MANSAFLSLISPDAGGAAAWAACILTAKVRREARHGLAETLLNLRLRAWDVIAKDIVSMLLVLNKIIINIKRDDLGCLWGIVCVSQHGNPTPTDQRASGGGPQSLLPGGSWLIGKLDTRGTLLLHSSYEEYCYKIYDVLNTL